ncbi:hypothetical protein, conserved [Babesia ovata]|uniref:6-Cys domain-containing protein n=1 Tax=Babesia ovata TaxID=189622 RepID=A0A2H6K9D8_9APIC|nr:uncharacterized protein BOVATA_011150 [Babesia ovata]GBE59622.1 hypothetical protein, conserved [Babesia ovata]
MESSELHTNLNLDLTPDDIYAITENRLIFICGPRDLVLNDTLQRHLDNLNDLDQMQALPWTPTTPLTQEIAKIGHGLGVFFLNRRGMYLPLQGCGSRPSPLFAVDNEVTVDPVTGTRSCVADPMSKSRIGFVCEGRIEPNDCMRSLIGHNGKVVTTPEPYSYSDNDNYNPWVVARYFNDLALPPFSGECRCIDAQTGQVKARMEIHSKTDHVCDISSLIERNRASPISGTWCSVVLHPGSTLTIRFPTDGVEENSDKRIPSTLRSQKSHIYEYETEFLPKDLTILRQLRTYEGFDLYDEVPYLKAIAGDALELDASRMSQGEVILRYNLDKPLALKGGSNSFFYHWTLKSRDENIPDVMHAVVNVAFAFTHDFEIIGFDRGPQSVFDQYISDEYCPTERMGNGIGLTYECTYPINSSLGWAGINCRPDEQLLPGNCQSEGYDLSSNKIKPLPESVNNASPYPIRGFQVFDFGVQKIPVSYACICVDERGYETSRLILEHIHTATYIYKVSLEAESGTLLPYVLLPWRDAGVLDEGLAPSKSFLLNNISKRSVKLPLGSTMSISCALDPDLQSFAKYGMIPTTWMPDNPEEFYYTIKDTPNGPELIREKYEHSIGTTPDGFRVEYNDSHLEIYQQLTIESHQGAILVSKDPLLNENVPITFVCGRVLEPSDLSIITGDALASGASALSNLQTIGSSAQYTWHVVEVNVETTDPYMQGCGVTYSSDALFKPETPQLYDGDGQPQFGCKIDLQAAKEAAFYCPAPYVLDPPNCFSQVSVGGAVKDINDISESLVSSWSNHFVILSFDGSLVGPGETLRQTPPLECRCVTTKGIVLSTIQIENYYAK